MTWLRMTWPVQDGPVSP